jgi:starch synthase
LKVIVAHPGTQYSYKLVRELERHDRLNRFYACIAITTDSLFFKLLSLLPTSITKRLDNRFIAGVPASKVRLSVLLELKALLKLKWGFPSEKVFYERNMRFQELIPDSALTAADAVIGFDTSSWILASRCKRLGIPYFLDVSIGHPIAKENIYRRLFDKYPKWKEQLEVKAQMLVDLERTEIEMASTIVVPSQFVKQTYSDYSVNEKKIFVNPFGVSLEAFSPSEKPVGPKIYFLFFGSLSARKGLPLLLNVWERLAPNNAELLLAGYGVIPEEVVIPSAVKILGRIEKENRAELFCRSDVFVFPSNFEGLAQVQIEACASGLPIISTFNAGGSEVVEPGQNGFLVSPENETELGNAISFFNNNPSEIRRMGRNSFEISKRFSLEEYGLRWNSILDHTNKVFA